MHINLDKTLANFLLSNHYELMKTGEFYGIKISDNMTTRQKIRIIQIKLFDYIYKDFDNDKKIIIDIINIKPYKETKINELINIAKCYDIEIR